MSARSDGEIALDILRLTALVAPIAVHGVREIIAAARPDLRLAEPPPEGQHAAIVAEDEPILRRRFGGGESEE